MKYLLLSLTISMLLSSLVVIHSQASLSTPQAFTCPVTLPDNVRPPTAMNPYAETDSTYQKDRIWVTVPEDGVLILRPSDEITVLPLKGWRAGTFTWMRGTGVSGRMIVSGKRLDVPSELSPVTPLSPTRQYTDLGYLQTGIAFPSEGCWEVTGTVGEHSIIWVMSVRFEDVMGTPEPH